jgi:hypothetical protein
MIVTSSGGSADGSLFRSIAVIKHVRLNGNEVTSGALATQTYGFQITCVNESSNDILTGYPKDFTLIAGQRTLFTTIPIGSLCEIAETSANGATTSFNFTNPISVDENSPAIIELTATNNFADIPDVPNAGARF